jgi:Tfp pilus assembly protein PilF
MDSKLRHLVLGSGLLLIVTLAVYVPVRNQPFLNYDDNDYVTRNQHVQAGLSWNTFVWSLTAREAYNWHPLTWLSHALDCQLFGLDAGGHHLTNLAFHLLNVLLLFLLLARATGSPGRSFLVAALFALHPLNVESVAWIAERKNVLSTFFFLLTLGAYGWYASKPNIRRYVIVALLFALGLAAKPMVITLPFVLLLLDYWPFMRVRGWRSQERTAVPSTKSGKRRKEGSAVALDLPFQTAAASPLQLVVEKLPLLALCLASAVITMVAQNSGGAVRSLMKIPFSARLGNALFSYAMYVWKAFWPTRLALYYPHPLDRLEDWQLALAAVFLVAVSWIAWRERASHRYLITGWLFYLGTMVPVIGIVQVGDQAMADRYAYVPLIGVFVMAVWAAADLSDRKAVPFSWRAAAAALVVAFFSFLTWRQLGYWHTNSELWTHTLEVTDHNPMAEAMLAYALRSDGRIEDALPHFQKAADLQPDEAIRRADLGAALGETGQTREAIQQYEAAISLSSSPKLRARSYETLATLYSQLGDYSKVRENYRAALTQAPELKPEMLQHLSAYIANAPSAGSYLCYGILLQETGQLSEARAAFEQALTMDPTLDVAKQALASLPRP